MISCFHPKTAPECVQQRTGALFAEEEGRFMKKFFGRLVVLILAVGIGASAWFFIDGIRRADAYEARQPLQSLAEQVMAREDYVSYDQVASSLYQATVAVEDARYYEHGAVDIPSLIRAAISQVVPGMPKSGGSTIAMQVVKNLYKQYDGTPVWKAAEIVLATRLCRLYTKDEILALYVNIINYGDDFHGISQASRGYYGIAPADLTPAESTLLAGIPQSPAYFQLSNHYENARAKQRIVLSAMVRAKMISQQQADEIYQQPNAPTALGGYGAYAALPAGCFMTDIDVGSSDPAFFPFSFQFRAGMGSIDGINRQTAQFSA